MSTASGRPPPSVRPSRPTQLGRWEVVAKIAGGGLSTIYLGRAVTGDVDTVGPVVALKVVRPDLREDPEINRMFVDEGRLLERLVHPSIVRTHEVGFDDGARFIAMELLIGVTLAQVHDLCARRGLRLAPEAVAWVGARIADALHYAHELTDDAGGSLGIIHRDVNPANVFVTFDGDVKLFDFGMARAHGRSAKSSPGVVKGTLPYLSPEQIMQLPLDRRSDVFGLGTTLWELLTSKRLFRRQTDPETLRAVHCGPIPDPRSVAPEVPEDLVRVVARALTRNREHRHPTAALVRDELDAFVRRRGAADDLKPRLAAMLEGFFPGESARQRGWLKPPPTRRSLVPAPPSTPRSRQR